MSTFVIGDVQGCYTFLQALLNKIDFQPQKDFIWFCGDLVNRGSESLKTLSFIKNLVESGSALTILGNHDLHLLAVAENFQPLNKEDTFQEILNSKEKNQMVNWIRQQPLCHYDAKLNYFLVHAGLIPNWNVADALQYSSEVTAILQDDIQYRNFLKHMYGNEPSKWSEELSDFDRLRFITNVCTRIRFCTAEGELSLQDKGAIGSQRNNTLPWFAIPGRKSAQDRIVFGHWAALYPNWNEIKSEYLFPVDSGCVWGNGLTAMCLETQEYFQLNLR